MSKVGLPIESFIIERLAEGGWRGAKRRADLTDIPLSLILFRAATQTNG